MDVAQGLEYLHHKLIVHGDLKGVRLVAKFMNSLSNIIYSSTIFSSRPPEELALRISALRLHKILAQLT
jgi:serine/threonine protein kinase